MLKIQKLQMKVFQEELNKRRETPRSRIGKFHLLKVPTPLSSTDLCVQLNSYQNPHKMSYKHRHNDSKFLWKGTSLKMAKILLTKNKKVAGAAPSMAWLVAWLQ